MELRDAFGFKDGQFAIRIDINCNTALSDQTFGVTHCDRGTAHKFDSEWSKRLSYLVGTKNGIKTLLGHKQIISHCPRIDEPLCEIPISINSSIPQKRPMCAAEFHLFEI